jgi:hypothetical protein
LSGNGDIAVDKFKSCGNRTGWCIARSSRSSDALDDVQIARQKFASDEKSAGTSKTSDDATS